MRRHHGPTSRNLVAAREAVCDAALFAANPWQVRDAWTLLNAAQGHPISWERGILLHLAAGTSPAGCAQAPAISGEDAEPHVGVQIAPHLARTAKAVRAILARGTGPTGGDAA